MSLVKEEMPYRCVLECSGNNVKVVGCWWHGLAFWASS